MGVTGAAVLGYIALSVSSRTNPSANLAFQLLTGQGEKTVWFLVGNGGMDPYGSPYTIPNNCLHNPFPHSLPRTRQSKTPYRSLYRIPYSSLYRIPIGPFKRNPKRVQKEKKP